MSTRNAPSLVLCLLVANSVICLLLAVIGRDGFNRISLNVPYDFIMGGTTGLLFLTLIFYIVFGRSSR